LHQKISGWESNPLEPETGGAPFAFPILFLSNINKIKYPYEGIILKKNQNGNSFFYYFFVIFLLFFISISFMKKYG